MNDFIFLIEKKELNDKIKIKEYKIKNNNTILDEKYSKYKLYIKKEDFKLINIENDKITLTDDSFYDKNGDQIAKLEIENLELYKYITEICKENDYKTYEQDLKPEYKYMIENNVKVSNNKDKTQFNILSIDIETSGSLDKAEIISVAINYGIKEKKSIIYLNEEKIGDYNKKENVNISDSQIKLIKDEKNLLIELQQDIIDIEPQLITGWNVIDFDFRVIKERMDFYGIEFKFSKFNGLCKLRLNSNFFQDSTMTCPGVLIIDTITLLKTNFISFEDYKLDTVAKEVLGDSKVDIMEDGEDENKLEAILKLAKEKPLKLAEYNLKDAILVRDIIEELHLVDLMIDRSVITNTPLLRVKSPIASLDMMYLPRLHERNLVAPSIFNYSSSGQIAGAFVVEPEKGFYEDIFVLDFKSLYPSVIMTFNIDPFTINEKGTINAPNSAKFISEKGILPEIIYELYKERDIAKKNNDKTKSNAIKLTMNSFYGAMGTSKSRFYNQSVAEAITSFARLIIKTTISFIEKKGHKVIYGDTDSIFVKFDKSFKSSSDKISFGKEIEAEINDFFENWTNDKYKCKNFLKIEFEKLYSNFFIASKKRYVGFDEITKKTQFVGMEAVRGDWTDLAKDFQIKLVDMIFKENEKKKIKKFISSYIEDLRKGKYDNSLTYKKKITKPLSEYTKTTPPHVKAARELDNFSGRLVKYVMIKSGPKHLKLYEKNMGFDYEHYVNKQLKGVSDDLLNCLGIDFDECKEKEKQRSLNSFFGN